MKRMWKLLGTVRENSKRLIVLCYAVFAAGTLVLILLGIAEDGVRRLTGDVRTIEIPGESTDAFSLHDLEQEGRQYTALSTDPRMELEYSQISPGSSFLYVRRVTLYLEEKNMNPGEVCVFYKTLPDMEEYDAMYRVWAHQDAENVYSFTLPGCKMYGIRIDPGIFAGLRFRLERVVLNEPRSLPDRLMPTRPYLLALAVVPLLAACVLHWIFCAQKRPAKGRRGKTAGQMNRRSTEKKEKGRAT